MSAAEDGWALFLDFDGTLVDIAPRPDGVVVPPTLRDSLAGLKSRLDGALAIVTGRAIADVDAYLAGLDLDVCGLHGLERRVRGDIERPDDLRPLTEEVAALRARFADRAGVVIEDKGVGLTIHWRMEPSAEAEASAAVEDLAERLGPGYRIQDGKAVREIVPARAGKGVGITGMMALHGYRGRTPLFVGDDRTDEHGFEAVEALSGVSVKVGPGETRARWRMNDPDEVRAWLSGWSAGREPMDGLRRRT